MARTTDEVTIGECLVSYKGVDIGHTKGGTVLSFEVTNTELTVDQFSSPVDYALTGEKLTVKSILAQISNSTVSLANPRGSSSATHTGFGTDSGALATENAGELILHPRKNAVDDESQDIVLYIASVLDSFELGQTKEDQTILEVTFTALPDETKPDGRRLGHYGIVDES